jgi:WD40 repeat protein
MNTGELLNTLKGHSRAVESIAITSDNSKIVSGSWDRTVKVWDLHQGECYISGRFDISISSIALSNYGNWIVIGDRNGNLYAGTLYL